MCLDAAKGALDAGPDEGGALGADSDEEEKRANRARAASKDPSSTVEGRNQDAATDVCPLDAPLLSRLCFAGVKPDGEQRLGLVAWYYRLACCCIALSPVLKPSVWQVTLSAT